MTRNRGWVTVGISVFALLLIVSFISVGGTAAASVIIKVDKGSITLGETIHVTVNNLENAPEGLKVWCELIDAGNLTDSVLMRLDGEVWVCDIEPEQPGNYTIWVKYADRPDVSVWQGTLTVEGVVQPTEIPEATAKPEIIVTNASLKPGGETLVTVNIEGEVWCELIDTNNIRKGNELMYRDKGVRKCYIKAPEQPGIYTIRVIDADGKEIASENIRVVESETDGGLPWFALIIAVVVIIAILLLFVYYVYYYKEEPKMGNLSVQVLNEQAKGVPGAKVTVEGKKITPKSARTSDIGWVEFKLPEGAWCDIKADKEGVGSGKAEIKVSQRGSTAKVTLKPAGAVRESLVLKVEDKKCTKIPGATVRIMKNNEVLRERGTNDQGFCTLEMPEHKEGFFVVVEKDGYERVRETIGKVGTIITMKKKVARLTLSILDEVNKPVGDVEVLIDNEPFRTDLNGKIVVRGPYGKYRISINKGVYLPYDETVKVEEDTQREIRLTTKQGGLKVTVVDKESGEPVKGITVQVGRLHQETNLDGLVNFDKVPVGQPTVVIRDPSTVYKEEYIQEVEIKKNQTTELSRVRISSSSKILEDKKRNLDDASSQLQTQREKLPKTTYDSYIPDYYMNVGTKLIKLVSAPDTVRIIRGNCKDPSAFMVNLSDVVTAVCIELGKGMNEKRNIDVFGDIKRFVVDKSLAEAPALDDILTDVEIRKCALGTFNEAVESKFAEADTKISKMPGNISPPSIIFRIAKNVTTWSDRGTKETRTLVALALLNAVVKMIDDPNVNKRLRGLIT